MPDAGAGPTSTTGRRAYDLETKGFGPGYNGPFLLVAELPAGDNGPALANVNPSFQWVRLAQRIPVRIAIDSVPDGLQLIVGQTATVEVLPRSGEIAVRRSFPW